MSRPEGEDTRPSGPAPRSPQGSPEGSAVTAHDPATQPVRSERRRLALWNVVLLRGEVAFVLVVLVGEALAFAQALALSVPLSSFWTIARAGGLYFYAFHHVALGIEATGSPVKGPFLTVSLAFLTVTGLAVWLLYRGGRAAGDAAGGGVPRRVLAGASVAVPYAGLSLLMSYAVPLQTHSSTLASSGIGQLRVGVSHDGALLWPMVIGAVAGSIGGLMSAEGLLGREPWGRRALGALAGGWRMFLYALGAAFLGLLVLGAFKPQLTRTYLDGTVGRGLRGADALAHHVFFLPDQSLWVLAPAMGACDGLRGDTDLDLLCYGHYPQHGSISDVLFSLFGLTSKGHSPLKDVRFGSAPSPYLLFLAVPAAATVLAGAVVARGRQWSGRGEAMVVAGASGVVFAALVGLGSVLADVSLHLVSGKGRSLTVGPVPGPAALVALGWGVAGGLIGGLVGAGRASRSPVVRETLASASTRG